ncbi:hypothetical protein R5H30_02740 [Sulfitobacter sp. D35]|uniref:hypothetical protein n=1 Tax=Sulfitobacter sp. D35 TaxID=3083252 RepID=UPI00296EB77F|nr:hypothetical protein [Sulfitobacter sp. D35]MDW4496884.1 hypothetical protein [Sulfitobacter sp. D35]
MQTLAEAIAKAPNKELLDLAAFIGTKFVVKLADPQSGDLTEVEDGGIVTALSDWAALHGGSKIEDED